MIPAFFKRLTVVVFFFPALFGWLLLGWIPWLVTGRRQEPWCNDLLEWANTQHGEYEEHF